MDIRKIDDKLSVTGQIDPSDMTAIAASGFKSIICNRPDNEAPGQPAYATIEQAARQAGLQIHYVPVSSAGLTQTDVALMKQALANSAAPILAYCRSGARSGNIYHFAMST